MTNRFHVDSRVLGKTPEQMAARTEQIINNLVSQLNAANIPITIGPSSAVPEGLRVGQAVVDWRTGTSVIKVWNGTNLV